MTQKIKVIFFTRNTGKLFEFKRYFEGLTDLFEVISLDDISDNIPDCIETGDTFEDNAKIKIGHIRNFLSPKYREYVVIADDSGMTIDALNGEPGVHTRRWSGHEMKDQEIIDYCLSRLSNIKNRNASYVSCFAIYTNTNGIKIIKDESRGTILKKEYRPSTLSGMPFRSLFYIPELEMMFHEARELSEAKRKGYRIGHSEAIKKIIDYLTP